MVEDRFWSKVLVREDDECWVWHASRCRYGYGTFRFEGRTVSAHIVSWLLTNGPTNNLWVLHHCDNPPCVNPSHLFLGTRQDNINDMTTKRRHQGQKKTHCPQGHEYTDANTYVLNGKRHCRACWPAQNREKNQRRKARAQTQPA